MTDIMTLMQSARAMQASDIHLTVGQPVLFRIHGKLTVAPYTFSDKEIAQLVLGMLSEEQRQRLESCEDVDMAVQTPDGFRQRVNVFRQQGRLASTIRILNDFIPTLAELNLPAVLSKFIEQPRGLILVTGPTGSGKSTTLAAMIEQINSTRAEHIITIEDPVEYIYPHKQSLIHQREVGRDTPSFAAALRSSLREDPDIILVGEMRDYETISAALTAAETGHLVMSTLHTTGAAQTIDRIIDACPASSQNQIRTQLSGVLKAVITQALLPRKGGGARVPVTELLIGTDAVLNVIRENKCHQLGTIMQANAALGMHTLNGDLARLYEAGMIEREDAFHHSNDKKDLEHFLGAFSEGLPA